MFLSCQFFKGSTHAKKCKKFKNNLKLKKNKNLKHKTFYVKKSTKTNRNEFLSLAHSGKNIKLKSYFFSKQIYFLRIGHV